MSPKIRIRDLGRANALTAKDNNDMTFGRSGFDDGDVEPDKLQAAN